MDVCLEGADLLAFRLCCLTLCCLDFLVPFPQGAWGRKWNSIVSVPAHCLLSILIYFSVYNFGMNEERFKLKNTISFFFCFFFLFFFFFLLKNAFLI